MSEISIEDQNKKLAFFERARRFRDQISSFAKERRLDITESGSEWPDGGGKLRVTQRDSRGWLEIESLPPRSSYCTGRAIVVTSNMHEAKHVFAIDKADEPSWLLLPLQEYRITFDQVRGGYPVLEPLEMTEPLLRQIFGSELERASKAAEA
jgi:hypothetical protein